MNKKVRGIYRKLYAFFGPQHWWPGDTPFEVAVGAILTQNTNWDNVEKAIRNLKQKGTLNPRALYRMPVKTLASTIRSTGYYNIKAKRLKHFVDLFIREYDGSMTKMKKEQLPVIREKLLSVNGIGPETADSIILYALGKPVFVIDAYTKRVLSRHTMIDHNASYGEFQELFHSNLEEDVAFFNEFHALFVRLGKEYCRTEPACQGCPIEEI